MSTSATCPHNSITKVLTDERNEIDHKLEALRKRRKAIDRLLSVSGHLQKIAARNSVPTHSMIAVLLHGFQVVEGGRTEGDSTKAISICRGRLTLVNKK